MLACRRSSTRVGATLLRRPVSIRPLASSSSSAVSAASDGRAPAPTADDHDADGDPRTLEEVMASVQRQLDDDESRRRLADPRPWQTLLGPASRAAWRSTDHVLGAGLRSGADEDEDEDGRGGATALGQTRANLIKRSGRTAKQLRRTHAAVTSVHEEMAGRREAERRAAANGLGTAPVPRGGGGGGPIEDASGNAVGSWRERDDRAPPLFGGGGPAASDDPSVALSLGAGLTAEGRRRGFAGGGKKAASATAGGSRERNGVAYRAEQTLSQLNFRLGSNYHVTRRVLLEARALLGNKGGGGGGSAGPFRPRRVLDFGSGVGSASAAALDVFGHARRDGGGTSRDGGIEWIHSVDASESMQEASRAVLTSVLEGAPWEDEEDGKNNSDPGRDDVLSAEDEAEYERLVRRIKGDEDPRRAERRKRRMARWDQKWTRRSDHGTRLTFGRSLVDASSLRSGDEATETRPPLPWQKDLDAAKERRPSTPVGGSFDLVLCSYTLSELPGVPASLAAAALLWEKLAPGGVLCLVEPGTPDGFSSLRSVRSMLIGCCPPPEVRREEERQRRDAAESVEGIEAEDEAKDGWHEECHVIAPCTHNGTCPMLRHQRDHPKNRAKDAARPQEATVERGEAEPAPPEFDEATVARFKDIMRLAEEMDEDEFAAFAEEELEGDGAGDLARLAARMEEAGIDDVDDLDGLLSAESKADEEEEGQFVDVPDETSDEDEGKGNASRTGIFDGAFCSFVHSFPGKGGRGGEKFSYLVVQKRLAGAAAADRTDDGPLGTDVAGLLAESARHSDEIRRIRRRRRRTRGDGGREEEEEAHHVRRAREAMALAQEIEDAYVSHSEDDGDRSLGLELVDDAERRRGWGRLVRAPLKKGRHVVLDYCSAGGRDGAGGEGGGGETAGEGTVGRITRQRVSRGWSARSAPGTYQAARKARWGGLWPDLGGGEGVRGDGDDDRS